MQTLFPPLPFSVCAAMKELPAAINAALPLKSAHKRDLPLAVEELSLRLTSERSTLSRPYWSAPRLTSAYVRYFLPWNIIRLARLFAGLPLPAPKPVSDDSPNADGSAPDTAPLPRLLVDVGSGPLTVPLALWMAKPEWRDLPLTVLCLDAAPQPLDIGKKIFLNLAGEQSPWRIITRRAPLEGLARELRNARGLPWLLTAANVINEIPLKAGQYNDERFAAIAEIAAHFCHRHDASALFVEPGTRLGGKNMVSLREQALEAGLFPVAPCPHTAPCPVQESRSWCHFTFDTAGTPPWLQDLSRQSNLTKDGLSLAFMLLQNGDTAQHNPNATSPSAATAPPRADDTIEAVRVISAPFVIPGMWGSARYACSARGLALLTEAQSFASGSLVEAQWPQSPDEPRQDKKSGAFILAPHKPKGEVIARSAPRKGQSPTGADPKSAAPQDAEHKKPAPRATAYPDKSQKNSDDKGTGHRPPQSSKAGNAPRRPKDPSAPKASRKGQGPRPPRPSGQQRGRG